MASVTACEVQIAYKHIQAGTWDCPYTGMKFFRIFIDGWFLGFIIGFSFGKNNLRDK